MILNIMDIIYENVWIYAGLCISNCKLVSKMFSKLKGKIEFPYSETYIARLQCPLWMLLQVIIKEKFLRLSALLADMCLNCKEPVELHQYCTVH